MRHLDKRGERADLSLWRQVKTTWASQDIWDTPKPLLSYTHHQAASTSTILEGVLGPKVVRNVRSVAHLEEFWLAISRPKPRKGARSQSWHGMGSILMVSCISIFF